MRRAAAAALLVGSGAEAFWSQEAAGAVRHNAVSYAPGALKDGYSGIISSASLGQRRASYGGTWAATPVINYDGTVLITAVDGAMLAFQPPEDVDDSAMLSPGQWPLAWAFTASATLPLDGSSPRISSSAVATAEGAVYWVARQTSLLWGIDTTVTPPVALPGYPKNLTKLSGGGFKTWTGEFGMVLHGPSGKGRLWMPDHDYHGALELDVHTGEANYTVGIAANNDRRLQGSVGTVADNNYGVVFTDHCTDCSDGLVAFSRTGQHSWSSSETYAANLGEFSHPIFIDFADANVHCVVASSWSTLGHHLAAAGSSGGGRCGSWPSAGVRIKSDFTEEPSWVSAPAVLADGAAGFRLFYAINLPRDSTGNPQCSLVSYKVDRAGAYLEEGLILSEASFCNAAPVAIMDAWGSGAHAVALSTAHGKLLLFAWKGFGAAGPKFSYNVDAHLFPPTSSGGGMVLTYGIALCGNYMAATSTGTVIMIAHDSEGQDTYLVAVRNAVLGPAAEYVAPPASGMSGGAKAAAAFFGTVGGIVAISAAIVVLAPAAVVNIPGVGAVVPADVIKSTAGAMWRGTKAAASWTSDAASSAYDAVRGSGRGYGKVAGVPSAAFSSSSSSSSFGAGGPAERTGLLSAKAPVAAGGSAGDPNVGAF